MYFYIDESGHTGPNLFDPTQPILYYGILASPFDVDLLGSERLTRVRERLGVARLHAAELGSGGIASLSPDLANLQEELELSFDLVCVNKPDFSIISFFDQVFDQGINPAVPWTGYWTPLRYVLLLKLSELFDEDLAKRAWKARLDPNDSRSDHTLSYVCSTLRSRVGYFADARSRQVVNDVLEWAENNPRAIHYNTKTNNDRLSIMPNIIGFQSAMQSIGTKLGKLQKSAARVIVDQQSQFNKSQKAIAELLATLGKKDFSDISRGGLPAFDFRDIPPVPIEFSSGNPGLEITDIYLWVLKRFAEGKEIPSNTPRFIRPDRIEITEISLDTLANYWIEKIANLPEPTSEDMARARDLIDLDEQRRLRAIGKISHKDDSRKD